MLAAQLALPANCQDHPLKGVWKGWRDLHVAPDWGVREQRNGKCSQMGKRSRYSGLKSSARPARRYHDRRYQYGSRVENVWFPLADDCDLIFQPLFVFWSVNANRPLSESGRPPTLLTEVKGKMTYALSCVE